MIGRRERVGTSSCSSSLFSLAALSIRTSWSSSLPNYATKKKSRAFYEIVSILLEFGLFPPMHT